MTRITLWFFDAIRNLRVTLFNLRTRLSRRRLDYILLELRGAFPEYISPEPFWRRFLPIPSLVGEPDTLSLSALRNHLELIALDPRPRGIILRLDGLTVSWGTAQSLCKVIDRFRESGKRVISFAEDFDTIKYYVACATDQIVMPPSGEWRVLGLRLDYIFLKDALEMLGILVEVFAVSPYKDAGDIFTRTEMSPEQRQNVLQIVDNYYADLVNTVSTSRQIPKVDVEALIDQAPFRSEVAKDQELVDAVLYYDELANELRPEDQEKESAGIVPFNQAQRLLRRPIRWRTGKAIGVVSIDGVIVPGRSRRLPFPISLPLVGNNQVGSDSVSQALRRAEKDPRIIALVVYVNSRGGSGLASDLISREITRIVKKKPVVVFLANVAASGGYYVAADASWIVAQSLTVTGSIGVIAIKPIAKDLYRRLHIHQESIKRGAHIDLLSDSTQLTNDLREVIQKSVDDHYHRFLEKIHEGRGIPFEDLNDIAGGRIWVGKKAMELNLVDQLGDIETAVDKVKTLAKIDKEKWTPVLWITAGDGILLPDPYPIIDLDQLNLLSAFRREIYWMISPYSIDIH